MLPCESQLPDEPVSISSMKRTPRSASRRATRHCQPKPVVCAALQAVERERRVGFAATGRTPPGASLCMPKAVSKERMRASSAASPGRGREVACDWRGRAGPVPASAARRRRPALDVGDRRRGRGRRASPGGSRGGSREPQVCAPAYGACGASTMNDGGCGSRCPGRSSPTTPMLGRAKVNEPVCMPSVPS